MSLHRSQSADKQYSGRRRSPSPRFVKRIPSPNVDPHTEADMNRVRKQVPKVLKARLYLLEQPGPNSFLIGGDSPDHKFKVIIGPQTCTCGKDQFCIHIMFVMLRVFQVKESDSLLWAKHLKNYEVESLFKKYHQRIAFLSKKKLSALSTTKPKSHASLPDPLNAAGMSSHSHSTASREIEEVCPICLSDLVEGESMTICKEGCQNRLHHHCMAVWAEECKRRKERLNCPLCRTIWKSSRRSSSPNKISPINIQTDIQLDELESGLPHNLLIPEEHEQLSKAWIQVFGFDATACLFSRDWKHRESGLRSISRKAVKTLSDRRSTPVHTESKKSVLESSAAILDYIMSDPVYNVFVAASRTFRAIMTATHHGSDTKMFISTIKPVIEKIIFKCADSNRRVVVIAMKVLIEFAQHSPAQMTSFTSGAGESTLQMIFRCLSTDSHQDLSNWQWWLGRLAFLRRLLEEHGTLVLHSTEEFINFNLPVSPRTDDDLDRFLTLVEDNITPTTSSVFDAHICNRINTMVCFSAAAIPCAHKKVHAHALSILVKCIAVSSHDRTLFDSVKTSVQRLSTNVQQKLHRHLSTEAQREHVDMLSILNEHDHSYSHSLSTSTNATMDDVTDDIYDDEDDDTSLGASASSSSHHHPSPPSSAYDPHLKCAQQVEADEMVALTQATERSLQRPDDVIPEQLVPDDDLTLVHVQTDDETSDCKNVYLEDVHWRKGSNIGTGAFCTCYEAMDLKSGRLMAVKQISFCRNSEEEQTKVHEIVLEEISLLTQLKHPNIVSCIGATQHLGHYNLFMELMPGGSVSRLLSRFGEFRETVIKSYAHQVLRALSYLHQNHTLHRDLKGANILVDSTGQVAKLSDFGTASRLLSQGTGTKEFSGQLLGTIPFMAPEVLRGEQYGRKCDIWSLGCCIIEMSTCQPPWEDDIDNHLALMFKIASAHSAPPIPPRLGPALRDLTLRCFEIKEADRPSAQDLLKHALFRV